MNMSRWPSFHLISERIIERVISLHDKAWLQQTISKIPYSTTFYAKLHFQTSLYLHHIGHSLTHSGLTQNDFFPTDPGNVLSATSSFIEGYDYRQPDKIQNVGATGSNQVVSSRDVCYGNNVGDFTINSNIIFSLLDFTLLFSPSIKLNLSKCITLISFFSTYDNLSQVRLDNEVLHGWFRNLRRNLFLQLFEWTGLSRNIFYNASARRPS